MVVSDTLICGNGTFLSILYTIKNCPNYCVKKEKLSYVQVFDKERAQEITKSYGVWGIPSVFLIDKNGVINASNLRGDRTEAAVKALLTTATKDG